MELISSSGEQGIDALKTRYREFQRPECNEWLQRAAIEICNLLDQLDAIDDSNTWYWHSSHQTLCLNRTSNAPQSLITISSIGDGHTLAKVEPIPETDIGCFEICYKMQPADEPWPDSWVHMRANDVPNAIAAIKVAISKCAD